MAELYVTGYESTPVRRGPDIEETNIGWVKLTYATAFLTRPPHGSYFNWLSGGRQGGVWDSPDAVGWMEALALSTVDFTLGYRPQRALTGHYDSAELRFVLKGSDTENYIPLINASFMGAVIGGVVGGLCSMWKEQKMLGNTSRVITRLKAGVNTLRKMLGLKNRVPHMFDFAKLQISALNDSRTISFTSVNQQGLGAALRSYVASDELADFQGGEREITSRNLLLRINRRYAFSRAMNEKREDIIARLDAGEGSTSDEVWRSNLFASDSDHVITLFVNLWTPNGMVLPRGLAAFQAAPLPLVNVQMPGPTTTAAGNYVPGNLAMTIEEDPALYFMEDDDEPQLGCKTDESGICMLVSRSTSMIKHIIYRPIGINVNVAFNSDTNCVIDCIRHWFVAKHKSLVTFNNSPIVVNNEMRLISLSQVEDLAMVGDVCIVATLVVPRDDGDHVNIEAKTILKYFNPTKFTDGAHSDSIYMLVYPTKLFAPTYHAVLTDGTYFDRRARCKICLSWFASLTAKHFDQCARCGSCGKPMVKNGNHYIRCLGQMKASQRSVQTKRLTITKGQHSEDHLLKNQWFADFECYQDKFGNHVPYCVVLKSAADDTLFTYYGKTCLERFIGKLMQPSVIGYLWFHNGSGYDANILIRGLVAYMTEQVDVDLVDENVSAFEVDVIRRGTKILTFDIKSKPSPLRFRCMYLFLMSSLARLCKDFKVPDYAAKTSFDHSKIFDWDSAEEHKKEVIPYCQQDVRALEYIYTEFSKSLFQIAPVLMAGNISLASHALEMWKKLENPAILSSLTIPPNLTTYNIFREMYHGGRVLPTVAKHNARGWDLLHVPGAFNQTTGALEHLDAYENDDDTELKDVDVVSLYPSEMFKQRFPHGRMQFELVHPQNSEIMIKRFLRYKSDIKETRKSIKEEMYKRCYQVDIDPNPNLLIAFLIRKGADGAPVQSLAPLRYHWVTGVELLEAIKVGYTVKVVHRLIKFGMLNHVFKEYIGKMFKVKDDNKKVCGSV